MFKNNKPYLILVALLFLGVLGLLEFSSNLGPLGKMFAVVFDSTLVPSIDNTWNFGLKQNALWQKARFSRTVGIGFGVDREGEVDSFADNLVLGPTSTSTGEGGQLKLLGTSSNKYVILDNYDNNLRVIIRGADNKESEKLRIVDNINGTTRPGILIGTSSTMMPGERLEVIGNIVSKGTEWTGRVSASDSMWRSVAYGNGRFVAVASSGGVGSTCTAALGKCVMTSSDGINWTLATSTYADWNSVTYGNGLFVAVAPLGGAGSSCQNVTFRDCVMTSPDGINWTARRSPYEYWQSVTYGNGMFVAVANGTGGGSLCNSTWSRCVMTSLDGISWIQHTTPSYAYFTSVTYGNGVFVAVARSNVGSGCYNQLSFVPSKCVMYSTNGVNWSITPLDVASNFWNSVTYGNGLFVAVSFEQSLTECLTSSGAPKCVMTSPDGISWTTRVSPIKSPNGINWQSVAYGGGLFAAVGTEPGGCTGNNNQCVMTSSDGISWITRGVPVSNNATFITYGNGLFVSVGNSGTSNRVMTSGKTDQQINPNNNIYQGGMKIMGSATGTLSVGTTTFPGLFTVASSSVVSFIVRPDGRVGIGTTTPESALSFAGSLKIFDKNNPNNYSEVEMSNGSTTLISKGSGSSFLPLSINFERGINLIASTSDLVGITTREAGAVSSTGFWFIGGPEVPRNGKAGLRIGPNDANQLAQISAPTIAGASSSLFILSDSGDMYFNALRVGIGTTTPQGEKLQIYGNLQVGSSPGGGRILNFDGTVICHTTSSSCPALSDIRLKKNINLLSDVLPKTAGLKPTYYNWRADEFPEFGFYAGARNLGLIAQDVEKIFPELVGMSEGGFKTVDYLAPNLTVYLIQSIKELNSKTDTIGNRIEALELTR